MERYHMDLLDTDTLRLMICTRELKNFWLSFKTTLAVDYG